MRHFRNRSGAFRDSRLIAVNFAGLSTKEATITNDTKINRSKPSSQSVTRIAFTVKAAVAATGLNRSTIYRHFSRDLPPKKAGGRTLILAEDLERFVRGLPQFKKGDNCE